MVPPQTLAYNALLLSDGWIVKSTWEGVGKPKRHIAKIGRSFIKGGLFTITGEGGPLQLYNSSFGRAVRKAIIHQESENALNQKR